MPVLRKSYTVSFKLMVAEHLIRYGNACASAREFGVNDRQVRDWAGSYNNLSPVKRTAKQLPGSGRKVTDQNMDDTLAEWIDHERKALTVPCSVVKLSSRDAPEVYSRSKPQRVGSGLSNDVTAFLHVVAPLLPKDYPLTTRKR